MGADIIILATRSEQPVISSAWVAAGAHVNTVGPKLLSAHETPPDLADDAAVLVSDSTRPSGRVRRAVLHLPRAHAPGCRALQRHPRPHQRRRHHDVHIHRPRRLRGGRGERPSQPGRRRALTSRLLPLLLPLSEHHLLRRRLRMGAASARPTCACYPTYAAAHRAHPTTTSINRADGSGTANQQYAPPSTPSPVANASESPSAPATRGCPPTRRRDSRRRRSRVIRELGSCSRKAFDCGL